VILEVTDECSEACYLSGSVDVVSATVRAAERSV